MPINNPSTPPAVPEITTGTYVGDNSVNRAIAHGLSGTPDVVLIMESLATRWWRIFGTIALISHEFGSTSSNFAVTIPNATNFYVGNSTNYNESANGGGDKVWVAIRGV